MGPVGPVGPTGPAEPIVMSKVNWVFLSTFTTNRYDPGIGAGLVRSKAWINTGVADPRLEAG